VFTMNLVSKYLLLKFVLQEGNCYCLVSVWKYNRNLNMGQIEQVEWLNYFVAVTGNFLTLIITTKVRLNFIVYVRFSPFHSQIPYKSVHNQHK
jgi:hypothetical protein